MHYNVLDTGATVLILSNLFMTSIKTMNSGMLFIIGVVNLKIGNILMEKSVTSVTANWKRYILVTFLI